MFQAKAALANIKKRKGDKEVNKFSADELASLGYFALAITPDEIEKIPVEQYKYVYCTDRFGT